MEFAIKQAEFVTSAGLGSPYPEKTAAEIDDEVKAIIDRAYARCEEILTARREVLTAVAEYLLAHETMTGEEFERMVGEKA